MITFENVTKVYQKDWVALQDITFFIEKGEFIFINGPTGAGKSTLLKLIYKEEEPTKGTIKVLDENLRFLKKKHIPRLRRKIGVIFQDFKLLQDRTLEENVAFALEVTGTPPRDSRKKMMEILTYLRLSHKKFSYPYQLSGGEQQKVAIARALVRDPYILLADEPTGNLDSKTSMDILNLFDEIHQRGNTIIIVTHEEDIARHAHRIIRLMDGMIESDEINPNPVSFN